MPRYVRSLRQTPRQGRSEGKEKNVSLWAAIEVTPLFETPPLPVLISLFTCQSRRSVLVGRGSTKRDEDLTQGNRERGRLSCYFFICFTCGCVCDSFPLMCCLNACNKMKGEASGCTKCHCTRLYCTQDLVGNEQLTT